MLAHVMGSTTIRAVCDYDYHMWQNRALNRVRTSNVAFV